MKLAEVAACALAAMLLLLLVLYIRMLASVLAGMLQLGMIFRRMFTTCPGFDIRHTAVMADRPHDTFIPRILTSRTDHDLDHLDPNLPL